MPVITYLKINNNSCIKLKFYINKPSLKSTIIFESAIQSNVTKNHTALIRLQKFKQMIYVSNNQISEILRIFKENFINMLFVTPLEVMKSKGDKDILKLEFIKEGYTLMVHVSLKSLEDLRRGVVIGDTSQLLIRRPKEMNQEEKSAEPIILKENEMNISIPKDENIMILKKTQEDKKFIQKYSYRTTKIVFKKTIKIEILKVPVSR